MLSCSCQRWFIVFGLSRPPAEGLLFPPFQSLFPYSRLQGKTKQKKLHIPHTPLWMSSSSIARRRLYLVIRSPRERPPNLINRAPNPTAWGRGGERGGTTYFKQQSLGFKQPFRTALGFCEGVFSSGSKMTCWQTEHWQWTDGEPDSPSGTLPVLRVCRFHRGTVWPFAPRFRKKITSVHPQSFYCVHHFPWTSILPLLKSSKISALQKEAVWQEACLFHKRLLDFLHQRLHFPEIPIHHKSGVLAILQLTIVLHLPNRQGCHQRTPSLCFQRRPGASYLQERLLSVMCCLRAVHILTGLWSQQDIRVSGDGSTIWPPGHSYPKPSFLLPQICLVLFRYLICYLKVGRGAVGKRDAH